MAFRRKVAEEVGYFDENIQYGFDEVEFAGRVCKAGYKMVLDPQCFGLAQASVNAWRIFEQNFQYGKGSGLVLKRNRLRDAVSRWSFVGLLGFISWLLIVGSFLFLNITSSSSIFFWLLFGFTVLPLLIVASVYAYRALQNKKFARVIIYPFIDIFRTLAFCCGQIYQLFKRNPKTTS